MSNRTNLKIAISGKSGCGNTTVSKLLAEHLGIRFVNYTFRTLAKEDGVSFEEICRRAEKNDNYDKRVDENQVLMAQKTPCVVGSRLAIWMLKDANFTIFLNASPEIRAQRIRKREGGDSMEQLKITLDRDLRDQRRYNRIYNIDTSNYEFVDLVLNTGRLNASQVVSIIEAAIHTL